MAQVKICGLREQAHIAAALDAGARYLGFNFFPKSPRSVSAAEAAELVAHIPAGVARVGLFVNPDDELLHSMLDEVPLDIIQLHGSESPERVAEVKSLFNLPVMKAIGISTAADLPQLTDFGLAADMLLVDAKAPKDAVLPGGNGFPFDWRLLVGRRMLKPWMLAGGLNTTNVAEAIRLTGATCVDVSSGVETAPGQKDENLIRDFIAAAGR